jgi:hypothetical protein
VLGSLAVEPGRRREETIEERPAPRRVADELLDEIDR